MYPLAIRSSFAKNAICLREKQAVREREFCKRWLSQDAVRDLTTSVFAILS
jgi:hypothetical protein